MQATIVHDEKRYAHQYREGVPRVGDTVRHHHGDEKIEGVVAGVMWISTSESVGDRFVWGTEVVVIIR